MGCGQMTGWVGHLVLATLCPPSIPPIVTSNSSLCTTSDTTRSPVNPETLVTKRIIALEGDVVTPLPPSAPAPFKIPPGHAWIEGDSFHKTLDSNTYGPVSQHGVMSSEIVAAEDGQRLSFASLPSSVSQYSHTAAASCLSPTLWLLTA